MDGAWAVSVGALDDQGALKIDKHIFIDHKADFYALADDAERLTGAQFMAHTLFQLSQQFGEDFLENALAQSGQHENEEFAGEVRRLIEKMKAAPAAPTG